MQGISSVLCRAEKSLLKSLLTKKGRNKEKRFIAEGVRLLEESIRHKWLPGKVYFAESLISARGEQLISRFVEFGVPVLAISSRDLEKLSDSKTSQGVFGLFEIPAPKIEKMLKDNLRYVLLLDNISDPGNAGTLIRSACAFGFDLVLMSSTGVDPFNPKVVRSSAGAIFALPIVTVAIKEILRLKKKGNFTMIIAVLEGKEPGIGFKNLRGNRNFILAVGSEATGLSPEIREMADIKIRIGHENRAESLNAAVAGSIIMRDLYDRFIRKVK